MNRRTKIIATLGPATDDENTLRQLFLAGMDVARLNFSHGTYPEHAERVKKLRHLAAELNRPVTILQDLQGPKLRVGTLPKEGIELSVGQLVRFSSEDKQNFIPLFVPNLTKVVEPGKRILLDDGHLEMAVEKVGKDYLDARVITGGILRSNKGVNLPGTDLGIPGFTSKDREDLEFGLGIGIDIVAISFVCSADDVMLVRESLDRMKAGHPPVPIVAKLERPEAIENLQEILSVSDGVMVARGDLAVETSPSVVPIIQKRIIEAANRDLKLVITATQMLDSMVNDPRPTRAEASDVANAIFDGTDAVMLSAETAVGKYPIETIRMMNSIILEAEKNLAKWGKCQTEDEEVTQDDAVSMTRAARELAHDRNVTAIAVFTQTGKTAMLMSKARPQVPIIAFTPETYAYHQMSIQWGVTPILVPLAQTLEDMVTTVENNLLSLNILEAGQQVVIISGFPVGEMRQPNLALLYTLGEGTAAKA